jgi:hypothetical protein
LDLIEACRKAHWQLATWKKITQKNIDPKAFTIKMNKEIINVLV